MGLDLEGTHEVAEIVDVGPAAAIIDHADRAASGGDPHEDLRQACARQRAVLARGRDRLAKPRRAVAAEVKKADPYTVALARCDGLADPHHAHAIEAEPPGVRAIAEDTIRLVGAGEGAVDGDRDAGRRLFEQGLDDMALHHDVA